MITKKLFTKQVLTVLKDIERIGGEVGIVVGHEQVAFVIQNLCHSAWVALGRTFHSTIKECQLFIDIRPQLKLELFVDVPLVVCFHTGKPHTNDSDTQCVKLFKIVAEPATLNRSTRRVGCRIKPDDCRLTH